MTIARRAGPLEIAGVRAPTLQAFRSLFAEALAHGKLLVTDLSLGSWQAHQAATELGAQLGLEPRRDGEPESGSPPEAIAERSFADVVGAFIDLEGRGDAATLAALDNAARLSQQADADRVVAVVAPRFGIPWEREDALLVRFLAQGLSGDGGRVVVVGCDEGPTLPADWNVSWSTAPAEGRPAAERTPVLGLVPGIVPPETAEALALVDEPAAGDSLELGKGYRIVAPETRRHPSEVSRFDFDKLAVATRPRGWVHAYAQARGNNFYVDPWFLWGEAYREVESGGYPVALRLAERAAECARDPLQLGIVLSLAQGVRIASQRFAEAAAAPDPPAGLPPAVRGFLLEAKGWALAMLDEPERAEPYFEQAAALLEPEGVDREYLWLLNIRALNRLKLRDPDGALAFERRIEEAHAALPERDWQLDYVNSINIARLARRRRDHAEAEKYYDRAFSGTLGARTEGDRIYTNVCLARLQEDRGHAGEALAAWTRAALHWAAADAPEALASRVAMAIVDHRVAPGETDPEEISSALATRLEAAADAAGAELATTEGEPAAFVHVDRLGGRAPDVAVLGEGWGVAAAELGCEPSLRSDASARLGGLLCGLLREAWPDGTGSLPRTIVVDDCLGTELPTTPAQLVALALRLGIENVVVHGRYFALDETVLDGLRDELQLRLGPAVADVRRDDEGVLVVFKRYLPHRPLTREQARLLDGLPPDEPLRPVVRELEQARVVRLELAEESLRRAGLASGALVAR